MPRLKSLTSNSTIKQFVVNFDIVSLCETWAASVNKFQHFFPVSPHTVCTHLVFGAEDDIIDSVERIPYNSELVTFLKPDAYFFQF